MLIRNYSYINQICGHNHSGITNPYQRISPHTMRGYYTKSQYESTIEQVKRDGFPTGTNPPYSIILGDKGALITSTTNINGTTELNINLTQGINISSNLIGLGDLTGDLSLIISMASSLAGSGNISAASIIGTISLAGALTSSGNLSAGINLISFINSALAGSGGVTGNLKGISDLSSDIFVNESTFTVNQIVEGIWGTLTSAYSTPGTMGGALGAAGTAADPWSTILPGSYPDNSAGKILGTMLSNIPDSVWDELKSSHSTNNSYGKIVQDLETLAKQIKSLTAAQL
mgnify:CR=1 FL=1